MTNLNYKDESNCILLAEVFNNPISGGSTQQNKCKR